MTNTLHILTQNPWPCTSSSRYLVIQSELHYRAVAKATLCINLWPLRSHRNTANAYATADATHLIVCAGNAHLAEVPFHGIQIIITASPDIAGLINPAEYTAYYYTAFIVLRSCWINF